MWGDDGHALAVFCRVGIGEVSSDVRWLFRLYPLVARPSHPPQILLVGMSSAPSRPSGSRQSYRTSTTRPWTGQSRSGTTRPGTARPQTAASTRHEGSYITALLESRGVAHEVGIAAMDKDTGRVMLVQVGLGLRLTRDNRFFIV